MQSLLTPQLQRTKANRSLLKQSHIISTVVVGENPPIRTRPTYDARAGGLAFSFYRGKNPIKQA